MRVLLLLSVIAFAGVTAANAACGDEYFVGGMVVDSSGRSVHVFDLESREYDQWGSHGEGINFDSPVGITIDGRDRVIVADSGRGALR